MAFALALHTTTADLSMAIATVDLSNSLHLQHIKEQSWHLGRELSTQVHIYLSNFMEGVDWSDVAFIAIAKGVGSFTGTRIGIVLARTLAEQLDIPVYAVSCEVILQYAQRSQPSLALSESLLEVAYSQWQQGIYPNWTEALPEYSSN